MILHVEFKAIQLVCASNPFVNRVNLRDNMQSWFLAVLAVASQRIHAQVVGSPEGFGSATTGGGDSEPQYPSGIDE